MQPYSFDCSKYNPKKMYKVKVTKEQFKAMLKSQGLKAEKQRKLYTADHAEIHHIGENTRARKPECNAGNNPESDASGT
jgi:hypothetical protein